MKTRFLITLVLALALRWNASAEDFSTPITAADIQASQEGIDDELAGHIAAPAEAWRVKAAESLQLQISEPAEDFKLLLGGIQLRVGNRIIADEFLSGLSDSRLAGLLEFGPQNTERSTEISLSRLKVAEAVIARPTLSQIHAKAAYDKLRMSIIRSRTQSEITSAIEACRQVGGDSEFGRKINGVAQALKEPIVVEDYQQGEVVINDALMYGAIPQGTRVCFALTKKLDRDGVSVLLPSQFGGSDVPLRCASELCFNLHRNDLLKEIVQDAKQEPNLSLDALVEVRFWAGMGAHASSDLDSAIELFKENLQSGSQSYLACVSAYRAGESYLFKKDWVNAAVYFDITATEFPMYTDMTSQGAEQREFIFKSGFADRGQIQAALDRHRKDQTVTMNVESKTAGGNGK